MKISEMSVDYRYHYGSDLEVVNAARVSFGKEITELQEKDEKLINYLARHNHWTPFGHVGATLRIKAPIFVARQLVKHQVGLVWNEVSRRYVDDEPEFWFPKEWRGKPVNAKQGSDGTLTDQENWTESTHYIVQPVIDFYNEAIFQGMAPEQARMVLPQNTMTEWIWTGSLAAWVRVIKLRTDEHAQLETQQVAHMIKDIITDLFPVSMKALLEN